MLGEYTEIRAAGAERCAQWEALAAVVDGFRGHYVILPV